MRGWGKEEVMKDFTHFQFVSRTTCERTQTVGRLQGRLGWLYSKEFSQALG